MIQHPLFRSALVAAVILIMSPKVAHSAPFRDQLKNLPFKIAYECYTNGNWEIFTVDADGSKSVDLTTRPRNTSIIPRSRPMGR